MTLAVRDDELLVARTSPAGFALHATKNQPCYMCGGGRAKEACGWCQGSGKGGWCLFGWTELLNEKLVDLAARRIKRLIIEAPVRAGKSVLGSKFGLAWYVGAHPDHRVILTGHNQTFANRFGGDTRDLIRTHGNQVFGVNLDTGSASKHEWDLADPHQGGLMAVGVGSAPTGRGGQWIHVDDPIKSHEEAYSQVYRDHLWDHWLWNLRTRLEPDAVVCIIMSRWHEDDLVGRLIKRQEEGTWDDSEGEVDAFEVLHLPALAEPTEEVPDPLGRQPGEALVPERYPRPALIALRDSPDGVGEVAFDALYQGRPRKLTGGMFPKGNWQYADQAPRGLKWVRWWDIAATEKTVANADPDWTAGVLIARDDAGFVWIADVQRIRAEPAAMEKFMGQVARADQSRFQDENGDPVRVPQRIPQDPGAAGKITVNHYARGVMLGLDFKGRREAVQGDKIARAVPFSSMQSSRNVFLVSGPWNDDFTTEAAAFGAPGSAAHDDQVDAAAMGYQDVSGLLRRRAKIVA